MTKFFALVLVLVFSLTLIKSPALAVDYNVENNGAGSQNGIHVQNSTTTNNQQNNTTNINNNVKSNANSGDNSASGNSGDSTIVTGDAKSNITITNTGNSNYAKVDPCCKNPTATPTKKPTQTPTPTVTPSNGGGGSNGGGSSNGGSNGGSSSPQILGLSKTSGNPIDMYVLYGLGLTCLGLAGKLFKRV